MFALFVFEEHHTSLINKGRHSKWSLNEKQHKTGQSANSKWIFGGKMVAAVRSNQGNI